jgi:hypothetical protein
VRVGVRVPASPSKEEKELLKRYAELIGAPVGKGRAVFPSEKVFGDG